MLIIINMIRCAASSRTNRHSTLFPKICLLNRLYCSRSKQNDNRSTNPFGSRCWPQWSTVSKKRAIVERNNRGRARSATVISHLGQQTRSTEFKTCFSNPSPYTIRYNELNVILYCVKKNRERIRGGCSAMSRISVKRIMIHNTRAVHVV
jgi:hypothetical protein